MRARMRQSEVTPQPRLHRAAAGAGHADRYHITRTARAGSVSRMLSDRWRGRRAARSFHHSNLTNPDAVPGITWHRFCQHRANLANFNGTDPGIVIVSCYASWG